MHLIHFIQHLIHLILHFIHFKLHLTRIFFAQERRRVVARLEKLRSGIALVDKQIDALQASELDRQLMASLKVSSQAMKKAGLSTAVQEAETVMNELDDQLRGAEEITTVLAAPLDADGLDEIDLDAELGLVSEDLLLEPPQPRPELHARPVTVETMQPEQVTEKTTLLASEAAVVSY